MAYNISALPKEIQEKVNEYIEFLMMKYEKENNESSEGETPKESPRMKLFGAYKGKIKMSPDFDDPLPGFEEYM